MEDIFLRADDADTPAEQQAIKDEADAIFTRHLERAVREAGVAVPRETAESLEAELAALRDRLKTEGRRKRHHRSDSRRVCEGS